MGSFFAPETDMVFGDGVGASLVTRYPVARLWMINTSLVGGCFSHPSDDVMALSANLEPPGLWCLDIADEGCYSFGWRLLQTWQSQPAIRREFCGAERLAQLV